ncbi:hypothetical protein PV327_007587 [Microctonus hyperodae]|uniref:Peptidase M12B domain-containing protein n=1 Tax=Microctonus hyperodae TaxID=165561 RepID=A0AA39FZH7_MICHY|nr:hypothetical protein PV327_007587 [Microctonus hyperodae]
MTLILMLLIFLTGTKANFLLHYNKTADVLSSTLDRTKRSLFDTLPQTLEAMIIDQHFNYIHLKWIRVDSYLANENLPIWTASEYRDKLSTDEKNALNVMKSVGRFVMYQDVQSSSSVVYFEETGTLRGVIDTRYYIHDLPINLLHECHKVGEKYVTMHKERCHRYRKHRHVSMEILKKFSNCDQSNYFIHLDKNNPKTSAGFSKEYLKEYPDEEKINSIKLDDRKIRTRRDDDLSQVYYIEILVFVAYDITRSFKEEFKDSYLTNIAMNNIIYFNAIDMIYNKLNKHDIKIHLNLAGIIIEDQKNIFSTLFEYPFLKYGEKNNILHITDDDIINSHFDKYQSPFKPDSFDLTFLLTSHSLQRCGHFVNGVTFHGMDIYESRNNRRPYDAIPLVVMKYKNNYEYYYTAAHEIAHSLEVEHDSEDSGDFANGFQCYGIMQRVNSYCLACIEWSSTSINYFKQYLLGNRNRCFLLNYPRSLYPDKPKKYLSPCRQCHCYGYSAYMDTTTPSFSFSNQIDDKCSLFMPEYACYHRLPCLKSKELSIQFDATLLPLDGTPCGKNKVCWQKECVAV